MDIALFAADRNRNWFESMANLEARKLINTANIVSADHLTDGLTRIQFVQDIKKLISEQFSVISRARTDDERMACIHCLRTENSELLEQARMLKIGTAKLYAQVQYVQKENRIVGYVISAVHVVLAGTLIATGAFLIGTMTPIGVLVGAILVVDGANTISREAKRQIFNEPNSQGVIADSVMSAAEFMGFRSESGLAVFNTVSLAANVYSVFGLMRKPGAWRLFHYLRSDFYRKVDSISRPKLTMKLVGYGLKANVVFDLLTTDDQN
ncbi:DUF4225 domain-containing protein [Brenneria tiliae]|uniref:DUF4225 domain-containing protein n=1 Tax=Brenneria tiliae TaxID=2914984 RepID=A0ABT0MQ30_9GAMM|nr:DUF4225 domain-containing protein [Brenneria tiliae]MCL2891953.1 DUF4225 domain-containing protein [Brenneria tiliae]